MSDVLFICTGNICRSPMAEGLGRKLNHGVNFFSRGISVYSPSPASANAITIMNDNYEVDIRNHVSQMVSKDDIKRASLILCMAEHHKSFILSEFIMALDKTFTLGELSGFGSIEDPFMGSLQEYAKCAAEIYMCLKKIDFSHYLF